MHNSSSHAGKRGAGCTHAGTLLQGELLCVHAPRQLAVDVAVHNRYIRDTVKIGTLEIRVFERGHVVLDPNFFTIPL